MVDLFTLQLIISFLAGGSLITLFTLLAERNQKIGGIIITLPSTVTVSLFFIAWSQGIEKTVESINVIPASNGFTLLFLVAYVYFSGFFIKKRKSIVFASSLALLAWLVPAYFLGVFSFDNLVYSILIYLVLYALCTHILIKRMRLERKEFKRHLYTRTQILFRGFFCGFIIFLAVLFSKILGPIWGALFTVFPAAYMSSMVVLHWNYDSKFIASIVKTVPLGHWSVLVYALLAKYLFPVFGFALGTFVCYGIVAITVIAVVKIIRKFQE